jgi:hypothetical protein
VKLYRVSGYIIMYAGVLLLLACVILLVTLIVLAVLTHDLATTAEITAGLTWPTITSGLCYFGGRWLIETNA